MARSKSKYNCRMPETSDLTLSCKCYVMLLLVSIMKEKTEQVPKYSFYKLLLITYRKAHCLEITILPGPDIPVYHYVFSNDATILLFTCSSSGFPSSTFKHSSRYCSFCSKLRGWSSTELPSSKIFVRIRSLGFPSLMEIPFICFVRTEKHWPRNLIWSL